MEVSTRSLSSSIGKSRTSYFPQGVLRKSTVQSASLSCRSRGSIRISSLAYPRTFPSFKAKDAVPDASRQANDSYQPINTDTSTAPVTYMGPEEKISGHMLFMHLRHDCTLGQIVALCNGLVGRVPCSARQAVRAHLRPISLSTPAGRVDWDPVGEELPAHMWTLLGAQAHELKLKMLSVSLSSDADLLALRHHAAGTIEYIQHGEHDSGLSAAF